MLLALCQHLNAGCGCISCAIVVTAYARLADVNTPPESRGVEASLQSNWVSSVPPGDLPESPAMQAACGCGHMLALHVSPASLIVGPDEGSGRGASTGPGLHVRGAVADRQCKSSHSIRQTLCLKHGTAAPADSCGRRTDGPGRCSQCQRYQCLPKPKWQQSISTAHPWTRKPAKGSHHCRSPHESS